MSGIATQTDKLVKKIPKKNKTLPQEKLHRVYDTLTKKQWKLEEGGGNTDYD